MATKLSNTKHNFSLAELKERTDQIVIAKDEEINRISMLLEKANDEIKKLKEDNNKYKTGEILLGTNEQKIKNVLGFRAKGHDVYLIKEKMEFIGIHVGLSEIETICRNIDSLEIPYQAYYRKCIDEYETSVKLNPQILKQKNLEHNLFSIDEAKKMVAEAQDSGEREKRLLLLDKLILTNTKILSDTVLGGENNIENSVVSGMIKDYEEQKSNVIKFDMSKIRKI